MYVSEISPILMTVSKILHALAGVLQTIVYINCVCFIIYYALNANNELIIVCIQQAISI
jgi:hypothetical protein